MRFCAVFVVGALMLAAVLGLGISSVAQGECMVAVQPGESIQAAIDSAPEGRKEHRGEEDDGGFGNSDCPIVCDHLPEL